MAIRLVQVNSLEDINQNFAAIAQALANITGEQIVGGSIGSAAIGGDVVPRSGGSFNGDISAPNITASSALNGQSAAIAGTATVGALVAQGSAKLGDQNLVPANQAATETVQGLVKKLAYIANLTQSITNPPTQAEVLAIQNKLNSLLNEVRAKATMSGPP